jgi:uncharacterized protein (TIGR00730 family)
MASIRVRRPASLGCAAGSARPDWPTPRTAPATKVDIDLMKRVCVFCGSSDTIADGYLRSARAVGRLLAGRGIGVVYGGGSTGLMGALADGALAAGGQVIGVLPHMFDTPALAHHQLTDLELVNGMHERKSRMAELSDGFIALPGGLGTFEELFEMLTWAQIGLHRHPVGLLNVRGYFDPLLALIEHAARQGFIYAEHQRLLVCEPDPARLIDAMTEYEPPEGLSRWVDRDGG